MIKQIVIGLVSMFVFIAVIGGIKATQIMSAIAAHADFKMPPDAVTSYTAKITDWPRTFSATGSIVPVQGVTLSAEEPGKVIAIHFESGDEVKQGQVLVELDTSVEKADLAGAPDDDFIRAAYETILCVAPTEGELSACRSALEETQTLLQQRNHPQAATRARENLVHALLNHNDFITIR